MSAGNGEKRCLCSDRTYYGPSEDCDICKEKERQQILKREEQRLEYHKQLAKDFIKRRKYGDNKRYNVR